MKPKTWIIAGKVLLNLCENGFFQTKKQYEVKYVEVNRLKSKGSELINQWKVGLLSKYNKNRCLVNH